MLWAGIGLPAVTLLGEKLSGKPLALAGATYAAAADEGDDGARSSAMFGLVFLIAAYGITGPLVGVTPLPNASRRFGVRHPVVHVLFGTSMALAARTHDAQQAGCRCPHSGTAAGQG